MKDTQYFPQAQTHVVAATLMPAANEAFNGLRARLRRGRERLTLVLGASAHECYGETCSGRSLWYSFFTTP